MDVSSDSDKPAVIILPGITGSELLLSGGQRVWPPKLLTMLRDFLAIHPHSKKFKLKPGQPIAEFYGSVEKILKLKGYDVFPFGYDWRLEIEANARELHKFIKTLGRRSVYVIAHSMGGLIATDYLANTPQSPVKKLVTLGTPFLGTPATLKLLELGDFVPNLMGYPLRPLFNAAFRAMPSWHELLPSPLYFTMADEATTEIVRHISPRNVKTAGDYASMCEFIKLRSWYQNHPLGNPLKKNEILKVLEHVRSLVIIGHKIPTVTSLDYKKNKLSKVHYGDGDGAVTFSSATLGGALLNSETVETAVYEIDHSALIMDKVVLERIARFLEI